MGGHGAGGVGGGGLADEVEEEGFEGGARVGDFGVGAGALADGGDEGVERFLRGGGGEGQGGEVAAEEEVVEGALREERAVEEDGDFVADVLDVGEEVGGEEDGFAAGGEGADDVLDLARALGVEAGGGFVEDDEVWVVEEGLREADAAGHALGEVADDAVAGFVEADHAQELLGAGADGGGGEVEERAVEAEGFERGEVRVETGFLGEVADAGLDGDVGGGGAKDAEGAGGGEEESEDELDGGGFAGTVGA